MNEYNHISPNVQNYNSYCIKIQNLLQEVLNPQKIHVQLNKPTIYPSEDIRLHKIFHQSNVPSEIKLMNPEMKLITVTLDVKDNVKGRDTITEGEVRHRYELFEYNFNKSYPKFFIAIMNSIKNNQVYIPIIEDSGMIRERKNWYSPENEIEPDLGLTVCDYINLEITQPGKYGKNDEKGIRINIVYTIYEDNLFEFLLKFNYLIVVKKLIRLQANKNLNIAKEVPIQTKLIRIKPAFTAYPEIDDDDVTNILGNKYHDGAKELIHTTNNSRYVKKNENVSNIPMAFDVEKYKPTLIDDDRIFNQLHNNININSQGLPTVKARFQKFVDVTNKNKTRKNKGGKNKGSKNKGGKKKTKNKGGKNKSKGGKIKKTVIRKM